MNLRRTRGQRPRSQMRRREITRRRDRALRAGASAESHATLDGGVVFAAAILTVVGVVMVYSTTAPLSIGSALPSQFLRHLVVIALGLGCAAITLRIPLSFWQRMAIPLWALCCVLLLATLLIGTERNGASRWLVAPGLGIGFQPAEPAKWATLLAVAATLVRFKDANRALRMCIGLTALPVALFLKQPDFGSAASMVAVVGLLVFVAGTPLRSLAAPAAAVIAGTAAYIALRPYALLRWTGFLNPWQSAQDEGFQLVQSFVAFGRGGSLGVGIGDGRQKLFYLPEADTDFILAVVAEELGLLGVLIVLGAFGALIVAGTRIATRARDPFGMLVAFAMTALIAVPAAVNAAVVMGLMPTTGFTMPFLSRGGTSFLICSLALGILLRIATWENPTPRGRRHWSRA